MFGMEVFSAFQGEARLVKMMQLFREVFDDVRNKELTECSVGAQFFAKQQVCRELVRAYIRSSSMVCGKRLSDFLG